MDISIANFIKYCMSYIKLTRNRNLASQQKSALDLPKDYFSLGGLLNGNTDGKLDELINLETFYSLDPKEVAEETEKEYKKQKDLANKIEDVYNKYRNDPFTKQIVCSFGYAEPVHNRMPAILRPDIEREWLDPDSDPDKVLELLQPYPIKEISAYPIRNLVNLPKNDGAEVIKPI